MPDAHLRNKRSLTSGFGEGTIVKRPRNNGVKESAKSSDGLPPIAKAISSGPDNGFRVKPPTTISTVVQRPARPLALPSNQSDALAAFQKTKLATVQTPARTKPLFAFQPQRLPPSDDNPFAEPKKKSVPATVTPLSSRIRPPTLNSRGATPKLETPARKVLPFHLLRVPVSIPDDFSEETSATPPKKPTIPKFDLGGKGKGKMVAMTAMEPPTVDLLEEKEVDGEALELQRGLLVSPEKGDKRRGKFIRNGLAERAQILIKRSSTALTLWKKETESSSSRSGRLHADLRLRVKRIIHIARNENTHSRMAGALRSVLAECALPDGEERSVLFSFAPDLHDSESESGESLKENVEVLVWKPWQETNDPPTLFCSRFVVLST